MKKIIIFTLLLVGCSDDEPLFKIQGGVFFESRFNDFVEIAKTLNVTIPRSNMILRPVEDDNINTNDSKTYKKAGQLYIDIDQKFIDRNANDNSDTEKAIYQQLANGLLGTPFRDCGIMKKVEIPNDFTGEDWDYGDWPNLFDPSSPCSN